MIVEIQQSWQGSIKEERIVYTENKNLIWVCTSGERMSE